MEDYWFHSTSTTCFKYSDGTGEDAPQTYTVIAQPNYNVNSGYWVKGSGTYAAGKTAVLVADDAMGNNFEELVFSQWSDGNTDNPREITVDKNYHLTAIYVDE